MKMTVTMDDRAISQLVDALKPHIETTISERMQAWQNLESGRLLRAKSVMKLTGMGRSAIYRDPTFPSAIKIGERAVAWDEGEVRAWIEAKKSTRLHTEA